MARGCPAQLKEARKAGRKIVGHTGRLIPEELIYASGAIPHYLCRGGEPEPPEAVLPHILRFMSPVSRAQIGYHLLGMDPEVPLPSGIRRGRGRHRERDSWPYGQPAAPNALTASAVDSIVRR